MSILIKMEMPKNCDECRIMTYEDTNCISVHELFCGCPIVFRAHPQHEENRPDYCPLIELPPHGRLIDASVIDNMTTWDSDREYDKGWNSAVRRAQERIADAPTIIEAEDSHKCYHADGDCIHDNCDTCPNLCEVEDG